MIAGTPQDPEPLIRVQDLKVYFPILRGLIRRKAGDIKAVDGVSFDIFPGETLGLVGESGCGKSTTGQAILQLVRPTGGEVTFKGQALTPLSESELRPFRLHMQMVFQDPYTSLNPRFPIARIIEEPLHIHNLGVRAERPQRVQDLLKLVGLRPQYAQRYPHEFSGGQRQRVGIARALATRPEFIIADEPISALDVSIQAQVINLLEELRDTLGLTYLFIAHDLSMVRHISNRVAVMYLGRIVEIGPVEEVYRRPGHPYTRALLSAVSIPNPRLAATRKRSVLQGEVPSPANPPTGCAFHPRCPLATDICRQQRPLDTVVSTTPRPHQVACHHIDLTIP